MRPARTGHPSPMGRVVADISMSLDGFVTGPDPGPEAGLGTGGEPLHTWAVESDDPIDREVLRHSAARAGAVVMGRRLFDVVDGPAGWRDDMGFGAGEAATPPFVVVTRTPPREVRLTLDFTFVTDGIAAAVAAARARAGEGDVVVMGGAETVRGALDEGLADELVVHVAPVVLGAGTPLWEGAARHRLAQRQVRASRTAAHVTYDVVRS